MTCCHWQLNRPYSLLHCLLAAFITSGQMPITVPPLLRHADLFSSRKRHVWLWIIIRQSINFKSRQSCCFCNEVYHDVVHAQSILFLQGMKENRCIITIQVSITMLDCCLWAIIPLFTNIYWGAVMAVIVW